MVSRIYFGIHYEKTCFSLRGAEGNFFNGSFLLFVIRPEIIFSVKSKLFCTLLL